MVQHSRQIQAELEEAVEGLSPAARAVYDELEKEAAPASEDGSDTKSEPEGFGDLTTGERIALVRALKLLKERRRAEAAEDADGPKPSEGVSQLSRRLWIASALISLACLMILIGVWVHVYTAPPAPDPDDTVVTTPEEVTAYLATYVPDPEDGSEPPILIPTGLYIESIQFSGPYNTFVSGYIWQRYANDLPEDLDRGVVLPEAESSRFREVYRTQQGNEELIGWYFDATLREQFEYHRYPLGRQQIWLQLWHTDFERNVYLAPDLEAYTSLDPAALPGLDPDVVLENWNILQSFFSYRANSYNANFGIEGYVADENQPELYYNISIKRYILSALMSRLVPPLVILIQLFVLVVVIGTKRERLEKFGVRPGAIIFTCAAFFFAVLVAHNSLREEVRAPGLVYLESVYIITYFVIVAVAINSVLLVAKPNLRLFRDNDNLWVEVLYWPTILIALIVITFLTFY